LAISNQKGGEGKTTTAVNLAASLAAAEHRVLLLDLDPQANASSALGFGRDRVDAGTYEMMLDGVPIEELTHATELPNLFLLPSSDDLAGAEIELVAVEGRERVLAKTLEPLASRGTYDFVVVDCPPSLGLLTVNALAAANSVLIPMQPKYFSLEGLGALQGTIETIRQTINGSLRIAGILFCMFDPRTNLAQQVVREVKEHFRDLVYHTVIPVNIRLSESPSFGKPALLYDIESKGAQAYLQLAREFLSRLQKGDGVDS
jgi:chromosome partitioning protein